MEKQHQISEKTFNYIISKFSANQYYSHLSQEDLQNIIKDIMKSEEEYMEESGLYSEETPESELIYDEEDAFNYILSGLSKLTRYKKWKEELLEEFIDDYLEYNYDFLLSEGLVD